MAIEGASVGFVEPQGPDGEEELLQVEHQDDVVSNRDLANASCNKSVKSLNLGNTSETEHAITLTDILEAINTCNNSVNSVNFRCHNLEGRNDRGPNYNRTRYAHFQRG